MDESLQSSKEILKQWENKFVLENKRKPSKVIIPVSKTSLMLAILLLNSPLAYKLSW